MDFRQGTEYRARGYKALDKTGAKRYDWERNGVLVRSMPRILFRGNYVLAAFLQLIDMFLITMIRTVRKIEMFKDPASY